MTTVKTEGKHAAEFVLSEANGDRSRENANVGASQTIAVGAVLGKLTTGGNYVPLAPAASDGSQTPAGIALYPLVTAAGESGKIAVIARDAEVNGKLLGWGGATAPQITAAIASLALAGIIVR
jgi:Bacteriophage lambda head decoration protein D